MISLSGDLRAWGVGGASPPATLSSVTVQDHRELVAALLAVRGVAGASVEPTAVGPGTLRLQLAAGTDEVTVAGEVNKLLRSKFGLAVDADRVRVVDPLVAPIVEAPPDPPPPPPPAPPTEQQRRSPLPPAPQRPARPAPARPAPAATREREPDRPLPREPVGAYARDVAVDDVHLATDTRVTTDLTTTPAPGAPAVRFARPGRLTIDKVQLVSAGLGLTVTVTLGHEGRALTGEADGAATQSGVHRSVARATLRAVERVVEGSARFEVEHVEIARTGADQTALVVVTMVTGRSVQRLSGASVVREDVRQAVIRAVLASVNRRMEPMLEQG